MPTPQGWLHLSEGAPNCTYEFPQAEALRLSLMYLSVRDVKRKERHFCPKLGNCNHAWCNLRTSRTEYM